MATADDDPVFELLASDRHELQMMSDLLRAGVSVEDVLDLFAFSLEYERYDRPDDGRR